MSHKCNGRGRLMFSKSLFSWSVNRTFAREWLLSQRLSLFSLLSIVSSSLPDPLMSCSLICVTSRLKCRKCACSISLYSYFLVSTLDDITHRGSVLSGSDGKESACSAGDPGSTPRSGRSSGEGDGYPLQYSCMENPMGRGIWRAYSLIGSKKSDTTEWLTLSFFFSHCRSISEYLTCRWRV